MDRNELIYKIGEIRQKANLSARALSLRIEMTESYINRLESKKNFYPSMEVFFKILDECNVTPEKFFYHDPESFDSDMEILNIFRHLTPEQKSSLINLFK